MNIPKLSVMVPVYTVEPYLRQCVDSILAQTFTDFELILVDDGSPDGCPASCDEYSNVDNRVRVIHKENGGLSDARNVGLEVARGDYIAFVDSDDYGDKNMLEEVLKTIAEKKTDWVSFRFRMVYEDGCLIALFSWGALHYNWYPYFLICKFSQLRHRQR